VSDDQQLPSAGWIGTEGQIDYTAVTDMRRQVRVDQFDPDRSAMLLEGRVLGPVADGLGPVKIASWIPVTAEVLEDSPSMLAQVERGLREAFERQAFPWKFRDPPAIRWTFDPFPRWTRLVAVYRSAGATTRRKAAAPLRRLSSRLTGAADRIDPAGAEPEHDDWYD